MEFFSQDPLDDPEASLVALVKLLDDSPVTIQVKQLVLHPNSNSIWLKCVSKPRIDYNQAELKFAMNRALRLIKIHTQKQQLLQQQQQCQNINESRNQNQDQNHDQAQAYRDTFVQDTASRLISYLSGECTRPHSSILVDFADSSRVIHGTNIIPPLRLHLPDFATADVGYRLWGAAYLLSRILIDSAITIPLTSISTSSTIAAGLQLDQVAHSPPRPPNPPTSTTSPVFCNVYQRVVLEIGAGSGLCSLVAYHLGASRVITTDFNQACLDSSRRNTHTYNSNSTHLQQHQQQNLQDVRFLDWTRVDERRDPHDDYLWALTDVVVVGTAVVYEQRHAIEVIRFLKALFRQGVASEALIAVHKVHRGYEEFATAAYDMDQLKQHVEYMVVDDIGPGEVGVFQFLANRAATQVKSLMF